MSLMENPLTFIQACDEPVVLQRPCDVPSFSAGHMAHPQLECSLLDCDDATESKVIVLPPSPVITSHTPVSASASASQECSPSDVTPLDPVPRIKPRDKKYRRRTLCFTPKHRQKPLNSNVRRPLARNELKYLENSIDNLFTQRTLL
ncbi:hypothetical protein ACOMHN_038697 [Nucella lapillus]